MSTETRSAVPLRRVLSERFSTFAPGVLIAFTVAAASMFVSEHYGAPVMLIALLLGIAFNFLSEEGRCVPGIELTSKRILKIAVALLGVRVTIGQIMSVGVAPLIAIPLLIIATIGMGVVFARLLGRRMEFGLLTGGAVAICGASAALALAAVLPNYKEAQRNTLFTVVAVTTLSTVAMVFYPVLFAKLGFSDVEIGILIGSTIHDVAQVVGAGYAVSDEAGNVATYVKMMRVAMLPIAVLAFAYLCPNEKGSSEKVPLPWFAVAFAALLIFNSVGAIPAVAVEAMNVTSRWLLVAAIAALGMKTSIKTMATLGGQHIGLVVLETLFLLGAALVVVKWFVPAL